MPRPWMKDPQWQHIESNPNPLMRPSVMALMSKLREMRTFRHPNGNVNVAVVEAIADDLIHYYFVREGKIDEVFEFLHRMQRYWSRMLAEITPVELMDRELQDDLSERPYAESVSVPAEPPLKQFLKNNRGSIEQVIMMHIPVYLEGNHHITCDCDKEFEDEAAWANHLRIRIEKTLVGISEH